MSAIPVEPETSRRTDFPGYRFELTEKGKAEVESDAMRFLRRRNDLSGRLSLIEQSHWIRDQHQDTDSSSAQPHRFKDAD
jgi:GTP-binding protein EngB required for normal cell division